MQACWLGIPPGIRPPTVLLLRPAATDRWACVVTLIFEVVEASSRGAHKASVLLDQLFEAEAWMQVGKSQREANLGCK